MLGLVFGVSSRLKVLPKQSDADQELLRVRLAREQKVSRIQELILVSKEMEAEMGTVGRWNSRSWCRFW